MMVLMSPADLEYADELKSLLGRETAKTKLRRLAVRLTSRLSLVLS
jgi:hypothetical protein